MSRANFRTCLTATLCPLLLASFTRPMPAAAANSSLAETGRVLIVRSINRSLLEYHLQGKPESLASAVRLIRTLPPVDEAARVDVRRELVPILSFLTHSGDADRADIQLTALLRTGVTGWALARTPGAFIAFMPDYSRIQKSPKWVEIRAHLKKVFQALEFPAPLKLDDSIVNVPEVSIPHASADLNPRGHRVLDLLRDGKTTKQIAVEMGIKPKTLKTHYYPQIIDYFGASSLRQALITAWQPGQNPKQLEAGLQSPLLARLTPRERQVLPFYVQGPCYLEIARRLNISPRTLAVHAGHIFKKLGVHSVREVLALLSRSAGSDDAPASAPAENKILVKFSPLRLSPKLRALFYLKIDGNRNEAIGASMGLANSELRKIRNRLYGFINVRSTFEFLNFARTHGFLVNEAEMSAMLERLGPTPLSHMTSPPLPFDSKWEKEALLEMTPLMRQVLGATVRGETQSEIIARLHISARTIKNLRYLINRKLGQLGNPHGLFSIALRNGVFEDPAYSIEDPPAAQPTGAGLAILAE